jgi:hypothetical protein
MNDEDRKFCRDCKHHRGEQARFFKCARTGWKRTEAEYLVTGTRYANDDEMRRELMDFCSSARLPSGHCGPDGKLYEPIEVKEVTHG